jgi:sugar lactone lactonase YvrE
MSTASPPEPSRDKDLPMPQSRPDVVVDGLAFPESPRWHDGRLWVSEKRGGRVITVASDATVATVAEIEGEPGGLGWSADGDLLVVAMSRRALVRVGADGTQTTVADVSDLTIGRCNDMVVDAAGNAYIGDFGYNILAGDAPAPGVLVLVPVDGEPRIVAKDLHFPNGAVISAGELIVAESAANRLTAFRIDADRGLTDRRVWAELGAVVPDGICLDTEGAVWVADPLGNAVVRVRDGGEVLERIPTEQGAFACELGGSGGRTLFICTYDAKASASPTAVPVGRIEAVEVTVPAAGHG